MLNRVIPVKVAKEYNEADQAKDRRKKLAEAMMARAEMRRWLYRAIVRAAPRCTLSFAPLNQDCWRFRFWPRWYITGGPGTFVGLMLGALVFSMAPAHRTSAHDWYPGFCCSGMDCAPVDKVEIVPAPYAAS